MSVASPGHVKGSLFAQGTLPQRARLISGLILFTFVLTHFVNHALGLVSLDAMEAMQSWRRAFWRSAPGTMALYGAFAVHIGFAIYRILRRRTWRMPPWEALQLALGLAIPYLLLTHVLATRGLYEQFGLDDRYIHELSILWPTELVPQSVLLFVVWIHAVIGIHYWLRITPWYQRAFLPLFALAVLIPVLASAGWVVAARQVDLFFEVEGFTAEQFATLASQVDLGVAIIATVGVVLAAAVLVPRVIERARPRIQVVYPGGRSFNVVPGPTLLEISRMLGIPHASVCGGRARCSTCRVEVTEGADELEPPGEAERGVLERISAGAQTRLACQIHPRHAISVQPLVAAREAALAPGQARDAFHWGVERRVAIMFVDMRNFTGFAEQRLPFDVVFILNRYLGLIAAAITDNGGYVDKFIGDGVMAIFGMSDGDRVGCRNALEAIVAIGDAMDALNRDVASSVSTPIRIGIGVHTGPAILGRIGAAAAGGDVSNQGITALGDTVNAASRLETATKQLGAVAVVSEATLRAAGITVEGGEVHEISVKGRAEPLAVRAFSDFATLRAGLQAGAKAEA